MKFRMLSMDELSVLEEDLKAFLIVNGIDGSEWEKINKNTPDKAVELVELFSDLVLEKVYKKISYTEYRSAKTCIVFHVQETETSIITLQLKENSNADLSTPESIHTALVQNAKDIQYTFNRRKNLKSKEEEVHQLLEQNCTPSSEEFWVSLVEVINLNKN